MKKIEQLQAALTRVGVNLDFSIPQNTNGSCILAKGTHADGSVYVFALFSKGTTGKPKFGVASIPDMGMGGSFKKGLPSAEALANDPLDPEQAAEKIKKLLTAHVSDGNRFPVVMFAGISGSIREVR